VVNPDDIGTSSLTLRKLSYFWMDRVMEILSINMPDSLMFLPLMKRRMGRFHMPRVVNMAGESLMPELPLKNKKEIAQLEGNE